jgi:hypothetical protein
MIETYFHAEITANAVGSLPVPEGQKRIEVEQNASTSFNLQTIAGARSPGDNVRLAYAFYQGDQSVASTAWTDVFDLRVYGWQDKAIASLALIRRLSEDKFKPTAAMSWLLTSKPWPRSADDTKRRLAILSGIGLTTMALDFDSSETVEVGIAPTISFFNDALLLGYGWNLQTKKDRTYAFFSFRLLSRPGFLN